MSINRNKKSVNENEEITETNEEIKTEVQYVTSRNINQDILREIKENFEDPNLFLSPNPKIRFGLTPMAKSSRPGTGIIPLRPSTCFGSNSKGNFKLNFPTQKDMTRKKNFSRPTTSTRKNLVINKTEPELMNKIYKLHTKEEIDDFFRGTREIQEKNKKLPSGISDNLLTNCKEEKAKRLYTNQERLLKKYENQKAYVKRLSKTISRQTNKNEKDLLINSSENYRIKKQLFDYIYMKKPLAEKTGDYYWLYILRRKENDNVKEVRTNILNIAGEGCRELLEAINDNTKRKCEYIQYPDKLSKNQLDKFFKSKKFLDSLQKKGIILPDMDNLGKLNIKGKNILEEEQKIFNNQFEDSTKLYRVYNLEKGGINAKDMCIKEEYSRPNMGLCKCKNKTKLTPKANPMDNFYEKIPI